MKYEKIFLVDDEDIINAIQTRIVKTEFPESDVWKFNNAYEVLKILKEINYDPLILLDLNMPEMNAIDFLKKLENKQYYSKPLIVILTFSKNEEELNFVKNHPLVKKVLWKPIDQKKINSLKGMI
ncbi:response regulator [Gramella sp. BOM4]|nr:response regulator [Christiangramia bathymodioli]